MPDKIVLDDKDIAELNAIIGEIPHKYAVQLVVFFNRRAAEQRPGVVRGNGATDAASDNTASAQGEMSDGRTSA